MYTIRKCKKADLPFVIELSNKWAQEDITIGYEHVQHSVDSLTAKIGDFFFVIEFGEQIVGYTFGEIKTHPTPVFESSEKYLEIYEIYMDDDHREQGQGRQLLEALMQEAKNHHIHHFLVGSSNKEWQRTVKFYEDLGFKMWYVQMYKGEKS